MEEFRLKELIDRMREKKLRIVTAESLTCGIISGALANISGASDVLNGGFSVYQDEMKTLLLDVPAKMLREHTAVSSHVASAMAKGALQKTGPGALGAKASDIAVAVTGYASNPGNLAPESDTGLVYIGIARNFNAASGRPKVTIYEHRFKGDRAAVRQQTLDTALGYVLDILK